MGASVITLCVRLVTHNLLNLLQALNEEEIFEVQFSQVRDE
jgi:hypothetical protein